MIRRIKIIILSGAVAAAIILIFMGRRSFISYGLGYGSGCANMALMAALFNKILSLKSMRVVLLQILSYLLRYIIIALGMIWAASGGILEAILFAAGLLTVNFSYIASSYSRQSIFQGK